MAASEAANTAKSAVIALIVSIKTIKQQQE